MKSHPIIFIPGFKDSVPDGLYEALGKDAQVFIPTWKRHTLSYWIKEYEDFIVKNGIKDFIAIGFSFGALIIACSRIVPKENILIAVTPLFREYKKFWKKQWIESIGQQRFRDPGVYIPKVKTCFIIGEKDFDLIKKAVLHLKGNSRLVSVRNAGHNIMDYLSVLRQWRQA